MQYARRLNERLRWGDVGGQSAIDPEVILWDLQGSKLTSSLIHGRRRGRPSASARERERGVFVAGRGVFVTALLGGALLVGAFAPPCSAATADVARATSGPSPQPASSSSNPAPQAAPSSPGPQGAPTQRASSGAPAQSAPASGQSSQPAQSAPSTPPPSQTSTPPTSSSHSASGASRHAGTDKAAQIRRHKRTARAPQRRARARPRARHGHRSEVRPAGSTVSNPQSASGSAVGVSHASNDSSVSSGGGPPFVLLGLLAVLLIGLVGLALRRRSIRVAAGYQGSRVRAAPPGHPREELVIGGIAILLSLIVGLLVGHL